MFYGHCNGQKGLPRCPCPNTPDLHGERDFVDVIKLKPLWWGDSAGLSAWVHYNHKGPYKWEAGELESEEVWQWKQRLGDVATHQGMQAVSRIQTRQGMVSPWSFQEHSSSNTLILAP